MTTTKLRRPGEETEIEGVRGVTRDPLGRRDLADVLLVVSGPDRDDEICLLATRECYLSMEAALAVAVELLARIRVSPHETLVEALQDIATGDGTGAIAIAQRALREIPR